MAEPQPLIPSPATWTCSGCGKVYRLPPGNAPPALCNSCRMKAGGAVPPADLISSNVPPVVKMSDRAFAGFVASVKEDERDKISTLPNVFEPVGGESRSAAGRAGSKRERKELPPEVEAAIETYERKVLPPRRLPIWRILAAGSLMATLWSGLAAVSSQLAWGFVGTTAMIALALALLWYLGSINARLTEILAELRRRKD